MTLASYAYGSVTGVTVEAYRYTSKAGTFDDSTHPTYEQVETWINQVSAMLNTMLNTHNIATPITDDELVQMLDMFVNSEVAALVASVNSAGRLGPTSRAVRAVGLQAAIASDVGRFISDNQIGFDRMGASRTSITAEIKTRKYDDDGNETYPIFGRASFGGETFSKSN